MSLNAVTALQLIFKNIDNNNIYQSLMKKNINEELNIEYRMRNVLNINESLCLNQIIILN